MVLPTFVCSWALICAFFRNSKHLNMPPVKNILNEKTWSVEQHEKFLKELKDIKDIWPTLTEKEKKMIVRMAHGDSVVRNVNQQFEEKSTLVEKLADKIAKIFGSVTFA